MRFLCSASPNLFFPFRYERNQTQHRFNNSVRSGHLSLSVSSHYRFTTLRATPWSTRVIIGLRRHSSPA